MLPPCGSASPDHKSDQASPLLKILPWLPPPWKDKVKPSQWASGPTGLACVTFRLLLSHPPPHSPAPVTLVSSLSSLLPPQGLCTCCCSAWNTLPPHKGAARSLISFRPPLKYPLIREAFPDTHVAFSPLSLRTVSFSMLFAI